MIRKSPTGGKREREKKKGVLLLLPLFFRARKCGPPPLPPPSSASAPGDSWCLLHRRRARLPPSLRWGGSVCCLCLLQLSHSARHQNILRPTGEEDPMKKKRKEESLFAIFGKGDRGLSPQKKRVGERDIGRKREEGRTALYLEPGGRRGRRRREGGRKALR